MDYYNDKYSRVCVKQSTNDNVNKAVDIVIKKNKIYKVTNYTYRIDAARLSEIIDEYVINQKFVFQSSSKAKNEITLYQQFSDSYIIINSGLDSNGKFYDFEEVVPVEISTVY
jgi:hypothetical protein